MENREKNLTALYSIRAGLSLIYDEKIRDDERKSDSRNVKYKIEDNAAEIVNYAEISDSSRKTIKNAKHEYASAKREYDKKSFSSFFWNLATIVLALAMGCVFYFKDTISSSGIPFVIALGAVGVILLIALFKALVRSLKVRPIRKRMKKAKELIEFSKLWIIESEKGIKTVEESNKALKTRHGAMDKSVQASEKTFSLFVRALKMAMVDLYAPILPQRYWNKIDKLASLVLFENLEIPAAIEKLERELSSCSAENVVESAHSALRKTSSADIDLIYSSLDKSLSELARAYKSRIAENLNTFVLRSGMTNEESYLGQVCTASTLRVALIDKIDINTMELMRSTEASEVL